MTSFFTIQHKYDILVSSAERFCSEYHTIYFTGCGVLYKAVVETALWYNFKIEFSY